MATTAGADFAFVLSQAGLLVTRDAPRDMPDRGRLKILWACPAGRSGEVAHLEMPREDLVPFGGAAPIDVFATRVEDAAILVVVMSTWNDKANVVLALTAGAAQLAEMIRGAKKARAQKVAGKKPVEARKERASAVPAEARTDRATVPFDLVRKNEPARRERTTVPFEPAQRDGSSKRERTSALPAEGKRERAHVSPAAVARRERTTLPFDFGRRDEPVKRERTSALPAEPAKRERTSALPKAPKEPAAAKKAARPRASSEPEITVGEASIGRETMLAIEAFRPRVSSEPEITVGEAPVGRETLAAIEAFRPRASSEPEITVGEASVGRETMSAIEAALPRPQPGPAPEAVRVQLDSISRESMLEVERTEASQRGRPTVDEPLVTERRTLPWVDSPAALKRTIEAREAARGVAPPEVKLGVEEIDPEVLEQALREGR